MRNAMERGENCCYLCDGFLLECDSLKERERRMMPWIESWIVFRERWQPCSQCTIISYHPANSLRFSTLSSLYPTNTITQVLTNQSANNLPSIHPLNPFPPKSAPCSSVCFQTIDTASPSSFLSPPPLHFDASNNLAAAPSARTRTPSAAPSRSIQSPPSFAAPAFYSINSPALPCFGTNCSWFVRMSRRRDVVHFPNFILK